MNKQLRLTFFIVLGGILARLIYPFFGKMSLNSSTNHPTEKQVQQYISNSKQITLSVSNYTYSDTMYKNLMRTKSVQRDNFTFYEPVYKKYFSVEIFDGFNTNNSFKIFRNKKLICTVNNQELENPTYGNSSKPIPIFKFLLPNDILQNEYTAHIYRIFVGNNKRYSNSVFNNLTYFTPKEEFQKMFPDQK